MKKKKTTKKKILILSTALNFLLLICSEAPLLGKNKGLVALNAKWQESASPDFVVPFSSHNHLWKENEKMGWACWVDEYYFIYPDQTGIHLVRWKKEKRLEGK